MNEIIINSSAMHENKTMAQKPFGQKAKRFLLFVILAFSVFYGFMNAGRVVFTYFRMYPVSIHNFADNEFTRWQLTAYPITRLVDAVNQIENDDGVIFTFRQSDIAYYTDKKIAVYTDNSYKDLFTVKNADLLFEKLKQKNITYLIQPSYPMPEINNSAFGKLLGHVSYTKLLADYDGYRLYELNEDRQKIKTTTIRNVDMSSADERNKWHKTRMNTPLLLQLFGQKAQLVKSDLPASVQLIKKQPKLTVGNMMDVLQPWDISLSTTPKILGKSEFDPKNGNYIVSSSIFGKGLIKLWLDIEYEGFDGKIRMDRKLLWSGVLNNNSKKISSSFFIFLPDRPALDELPGFNRNARLFFTMEQAGSLGINSLNIDRVYFDELTIPQTDFVEFNNAIAAGWQPNRFYNYLGQLPYGHFGINKNNILTVRQTNSDPVKFIYGPLFPYNDRTNNIQNNANSNITAVTIDMSLSVSGRGVLTPVIEYQCQDRVRKAIGLHPVSLREKFAKLQFTKSFDCMPNSFHIFFTLSNDTLRLPPDFSLAKTSIRPIALNVNFWQGSKILTSVNEFDTKNPYNIYSDRNVIKLEPGLFGQ